MNEKPIQKPPLVMVALLPFPYEREATEILQILLIPQLPAAQHLAVEPKVQVLAATLPQALELQAVPPHQEPATEQTHAEIHHSTTHCTNKPT